ncbi:MAG: hypothetical protein LBR13_05950 [Dysgonamonadaceae bacterium]|nr:hypothetical protein [Dysgonamonadaceae bacterium]
MLYCIINLIVNTYIFGGFEKALVRFYYLMPEYEVPYFFLYALNLFFFLTSFLLVVLSINYSIFKRGYIWLFLSFIALTFTMFSSGTRGYLINTTLFIIIGVLAGGIYSKHKVIRTLLSFKILFFVIISLLSSALLTNIRTNEYESISDVIDEIGAENIYIDESKGGIGEGVLEQTDMVINTFGSQYEYLHPFYTIASIVVNPIPRMFWKDKPVGVGLIMSEASLGYSNFDPKYLAEEYDISFAMGVAGEGWMQGGWISMIYLSSFFGLLAGFWANMTKFCFQKKNYFYAIVGLMTLNALMLLNRGDMLSAFTQGTYPILFFFIIAFILNPLLKRR